MKYEFLSSNWLAAYHGIVAGLAVSEAKTRPQLALSMCEVIHTVPAHLSSSGTVAWCFVVAGPHLTFSLEERDDVDFKVVIDYHAATTLCTYVTDDDPQRVTEFEEMVNKLVSSGKFSMPYGPRRHDANSPASLHDLIARLTFVR